MDYYLEVIDINLGDIGGLTWNAPKELLERAGLKPDAFTEFKNLIRKFFLLIFLLAKEDVSERQATMQKMDKAFQNKIDKLQQPPT